MKKAPRGFGLAEGPGELFYDTVLECSKASQPPNLSQ